MTKSPRSVSITFLYPSLDTLFVIPSLLYHDVCLRFLAVDIEFHIFGPPEGEGPIRYPLSVCMSVCLYVTALQP